MPTTNGNRKILDLKRWEQVTPAPSASVAGSMIVSSRHFRQNQLYVNGTTSAFLYNPNEDGWVQLPSPALAGSLSAGAAGCSAAISVGTAVGGTTIAAGSNGLTLPQATINVASTTGFPLAGAFYVDTATNGRQLIVYTGTTGTSFTGCTGGTGTLVTSQVVSFAGLGVHAGSTTSVTINQLLARDLRGYSIHVLSGANAGSTIAITSNTTWTGSTTIAAGSNGAALPQATINVASTANFPPSGQFFVDISGTRQLITYTGITATSFTGCSGGTGTLATSQVVQFASSITFAAQASAFTTASVIRLIAPSFYVLGAGTLAAGSFRKYDFATNTWTSLSITGLAATLGTDGRLIHSTPRINNDYVTFSNGTATAGAATTLTDSSKTWAVNQWTEYQVRIVSGTGAGQVRRIASNTATALTVSGWNTNPDATSVYVIEGNEDYIYYIGNNAVTMYRYSIANNSWTTLSPAVARAAAPSTGMSGNWVFQVSDSAWTSQSSIINGRRIYSFRGGAGSVLDYYDIPSNTWVNAVNYAPNTETFTTGTKYEYFKDNIYIQKDATSRWFVFNIVNNSLDGWTTMAAPQTTAIVGDTSFGVTYTDGATEIFYMYFLLNTSTLMYRQMAI